MEPVKLWRATVSRVPRLNTGNRVYGWFQTHWLFLGLGFAQPLLYWFGLAVRYPLTFGLQHANATWIKPNAGSFTALTLHAGLYLLLTVIYVAALRLCTSSAVGLSPKRPDCWFIFLIWLLSSVSLLFVSPNGESHDLYDYTFRGRLLDFMGASPLAQTPNQFPSMAFYRYIAWREHVDTYGPLWEYVSWGVARSVRLGLTWASQHAATPGACPATPRACQVLAAYLTSYRLVAIGLTGLAGVFVYQLIQATRPQEARWALVAWLWNPLLLISSALGAHNDAVLLLLLFVTFWLWQRQRWLLGWLSFGLAAHVKLTVLLLLPLLGLWLLRRLGWWRALGYSLLAVLVLLPLSWLLYQPLGGWATLPRMLHERQLFVAHSWAQILDVWLYRVWHWPYPVVWLMTLQWPTWLFLVVAAVLLLRFLTTPLGNHHLYRAATLLTLLNLFVASFWFQPWYVVWVLAPAVLWGATPFTQSLLPWLCFGALSSNVLYDHLTQMQSTIWPDASRYRLFITVCVVITIWLPLFLAWSRYHLTHRPSRD